MLTSESQTEEQEKRHRLNLTLGEFKMNLIQDPWIPVVFVDGTNRDVGIREALGRANQVRAVAIEPAFVGVAVIRLLLAVVLDAFGPAVDEDDFVKRWQTGCFDEQELDKYLEGVRDRFNLFDESAPFAQVAGLRTPRGESKPVSLLIATIATGNNVPLFSVRTDAEPPKLTSAEAARWLVASHCYDTAGIKPGAEGDPKMKNGKVTAGVAPLGQFGAVVALGRSLFETLVLNSVIERRGPAVIGKPSWRKLPVGPQWSEETPPGLLDWLTLQARRVRLVPDDERGPDGETTVSRVVLTSGDKPNRIPEFEPHATWRAVKNPKPDDPPFRPVRHRSDWTAWQGLAALLATADDGGSSGFSTSPVLRQIGALAAYGDLADDYPLEVMIAGVEYGNMQAVVENTIDDRIPLSVVALRGDAGLRQFLLDVVASHEGLANALNDLDRDLRDIHSAEPIPWDKGQRIGAVFTHRIDPTVRRMLGGLQAEPERLDDAIAMWAKFARLTALDMGNERLSAVPTSAYRGARTSDGASAQIAEAPIVMAERFFRSRVNRALKEFQGADSELTSEPKETVG